MTAPAVEKDEMLAYFMRVVGPQVHLKDIDAHNAIRDLIEKYGPGGEVAGGNVASADEKTQPAGQSSNPGPSITTEEALAKIQNLIDHVVCDTIAVRYTTPATAALAYLRAALAYRQEKEKAESSPEGGHIGAPRGEKDEGFAPQSGRDKAKVG